MQRALSFKASPPLGAPLRFLVSAPLFALLAAMLMLWAGPVALASRWNGYALALTHLFTLGVLGNAMMGAMMQVMPVATGISVLAPRATAWLVHGLLSLGALALAAGFLWVDPRFFGAAAPMLVACLLWFVAATAGALWRDRKRASKGSREILSAIRLALVSLLFTALLGGALAGSMALALPLPRQLTDLHGAWGLLGWVGLLIVGIAFQVIPMFQVTELYPKPITRWLTLTIFVLLLGHMANALLPSAAQWEAGFVLAVALLACYLAFATASLQLLRHRKRPEPDTTTLFWRVSLGCLAAMLPVWLLHAARVADFSVLLGVLFIAGFAWSAVNGMLYKILPFLLWYHAQKDLTVALRVVPKVKEIIPDHSARPQFRIHLGAIILLLLASVQPGLFTHAAALALLLSTAWLCWTVLGALRLYTRARREIAAALAAMDG